MADRVTPAGVIAQPAQEPEDEFSAQEGAQVPGLRAASRSRQRNRHAIVGSYGIYIHA